MERKITVETKPCPMCGHTHFVEVYPAHLKDWKNGKLIQDAIPELDLDEREMLMTGTCPQCWRNLFK